MPEKDEQLLKALSELKRMIQSATHTPDHYGLTKYKKKPVIIDAVQWDSTDAGCLLLAKQQEWKLDIEGSVFIATLEGVLKANKGDFIIRGVKGEFYPCRPDIFFETYDKA